MKSNDLIINEWYKGIGKSPHLGFADMRQVDPFSEPGVLKLNHQLSLSSAAAVTTTFTANATTDVITVGSTFGIHGHSGTNRAVTLSTTGTLPAGLVAATVYYLIEVTSLTYKLATTLDNADAGTPVIDITSTGSGTHTITSVNVGNVKYIVQEPRAGALYAQDTNGRIWESSAAEDWFLINGNTLTNPYGQGLAIWKNYLFAFRSAKVDVWGPLTSARASRTWTNDWATLNASAGGTVQHDAIVGQDDKLYFADKDDTSTGIPYVGSIAQATGTFAPGTPSTYTFDNQALDLPGYKTITKLAELGTYLMIGTTGKEIYPWDRVSSSFDIPVVSAESNITAMVTTNNLLYFAAGYKGNIYATNRSSAERVFEFPIANSNYPYDTVSIPAMTENNGRIFFTVVNKNCSGVYSYHTGNRALIMENRVTSNATLNGTSMNVLYPYTNGQYFVSWYNPDASTYGIDTNYLSNWYYVPSYAGYVDSPFYQVGSKYSKKSFTELEINLDRPLASGQGVKISYRSDLSASFTTIATIDYTTYSGIQHYVVPTGISDVEFIQIRCELTVGSSALATPKLRNIILR